MSTNESNQNSNMCMVYMSALGVRYKYQSQRKSIALLACGKTETRKSMGMFKFMEPIRENLNKLRNSKLIVRDKLVNIKLCQVKGDNKNQNEMIIEIAQGFNGDDACKWCIVSKEDLIELILAEERLLGNHALRGCPFVSNKLFCPDIFHDLNENGVIEKLFKRMFRLTTSNQQQQVKEYNQRVQSVAKNFDQLFLNTFRISVGKGSKIKLNGTGMQKYEFFTIFFLIDQQVPRSSKRFEAYFLLRAIVDFCNSPRILRSDLPIFERLVRKFLVVFKQAFPEETITYKLHHMLHYSTLVLEFGPLVFCSTLRYERVHQKVLRSIEGSRNTKNVQYSIVSNFELDLNLINSKVVERRLSNLSEISEIYLGTINLFHFNSITDILELKSLTIDSQQVQKGRFYLYREQRDGSSLPVFIQVQKIYLINNQPFLFGRLFKAISFKMELVSFEIQRSHELISFNIGDLKHHEDLLMFNTSEDQKFIIKTFHIPFVISNGYLKLIIGEEFTLYQN